MKRTRDTITPDDQRVIAEALLDPPPLGQRLLAAIERYRTLYGPPSPRTTLPS